MHLNSNYERFMRDENRRANRGAKGEFEPEEPMPIEAPEYTEQEMLEIEERANYEDLMRESWRQP